MYTHVNILFSTNRKYYHNLATKVQSHVQIWQNRHPTCALNHTLLNSHHTSSSHFPLFLNTILSTFLPLSSHSLRFSSPRTPSFPLPILSSPPPFLTAINTSLATFPIPTASSPPPLIPPCHNKPRRVYAPSGKFVHNTQRRSRGMSTFEQAEVMVTYFTQQIRTKVLSGPSSCTDSQESFKNLFSSRMYFVIFPVRESKSGAHDFLLRQQLDREHATRLW